MSRQLVAEFLADHQRRLGRPVETVLQDLDGLHDLLLKWQRVQNLVSRETDLDFWTRHALDSLQLLPLLGEARALLDLGSGGGFPALPMAIALKGTESQLHLVEANGRKCAFLSAARRELGLPVTVHQARIEQLDLAKVPVPDVITARALASLEVLVPYAARFAGPGTRLLLHKGREYGEELAHLDSVARKDVLIHPSLVGNDGVILEWPAGTIA